MDLELNPRTTGMILEVSYFSASQLPPLVNYIVG